jgi:hypothetical protein
MLKRIPVSIPANGEGYAKKCLTMLAVAYIPAPPSVLHLFRHARHSFDSAFTGRFDADKDTVLQNKHIREFALSCPFCSPIVCKCSAMTVAKVQFGALENRTETSIYLAHATARRHTFIAQNQACKKQATS